MKNIPLLKKHLEEEWDKLERRGREGAERKRKLEALSTSQSTEDEGKQQKKSKSGANTS